MTNQKTYRPLRDWIAVLLTALIFCAGCTTTRSLEVSRADAPFAETIHPARHSGMYVAKWSEGGRQPLRTIADSDVYVRQNDALGFTRGPDGALVGVHGSKQIPLAGVSPSAQYVVWVEKAEVQTQFGREMDKTGEGSMQALRVVGIVTVVALFAVGVFYGCTHFNWNN